MQPLTSNVSQNDVFRRTYKWRREIQIQYLQFGKFNPAIIEYFSGRISRSAEHLAGRRVVPLAWPCSGDPKSRLEVVFEVKTTDFRSIFSHPWWNVEGWIFHSDCSTFRDEFRVPRNTWQVGALSHWIGHLLETQKVVWGSFLGSKLRILGQFSSSLVKCFGRFRVSRFS